MKDSDLITPSHLLSHLEISFVEKPNRVSYQCPFHADTVASAGFYNDSGLAHCFACQYTLGVVSFYQRWLSENKNIKLSRYEAKTRLEEALGRKVKPGNSGR